MLCITRGRPTCLDKQEVGKASGYRLSWTTAVPITVLIAHAVFLLERGHSLRDMQLTAQQIRNR